MIEEDLIYAPLQNTPKTPTFQPSELEDSINHVALQSFSPHSAIPPILGTILGELRLRKARFTHPCKTPQNYGFQHEKKLQDLINHVALQSFGPHLVRIGGWGPKDWSAGMLNELLSFHA